MPKRSSESTSTDVDVSVRGSAQVDLTINGNKVRLAVKRPRKRKRRSQNSESVALASQAGESFFQHRWHRDGDAAMAPFTGGVCAGIAHSLGINPLWLRLAFIGVVWTAGVGLLAYLVLWAMLPDRKNRKSARLYPRPKAKTEALPAPREDVPQDLVDAWKEVNEITKN